MTCNSRISYEYMIPSILLILRLIGWRSSLGTKYLLEHDHTAIL